MDESDTRQPQLIAEPVDLKSTGYLSKYLQRQQHQQQQKQGEGSTIFYDLIPSLETVSVFSLGGLLFLIGFEILRFVR